MTEEAEKKIKELEDKIAYYEGHRAAEFYTALMGGLDYITKEIKSKRLDLDSDPFAKSIFTLAKDSDKLMAAIGKGMASFQVKDENGGKSKKHEKSETKAL